MGKKGREKNALNNELSVWSYSEKACPRHEGCQVEHSSYIEKWIYARQQHKEHCMVERMSAFIRSDSDANTSYPGHEKASYPFAPLHLILFPNKHETSFTLFCLAGSAGDPPQRWLPSISSGGLFDGALSRLVILIMYYYELSKNVILQLLPELRHSLQWIYFKKVCSHRCKKTEFLVKEKHL